ncbi:hypothetical protein [Pseudobutyrivibrio xylanivorans]|uniref:Uncharacterized protein n=1 Tax=Pseudobutyrivibrio xylanivorans TaxID=185007 RepID=A0A5P6VUG3_PSEXY|nr:hypothetical protein [Pseudobutyrivibrio xylanivorans]QFJ54874.1 hypothetical protein FXF36_08400 [Pseudobutyrivibrio xylanivorans]
MSSPELSCIYEMNMFQEDKELNEDILSGRAFDVLLTLLDSKQTSENISRRLKMPNFSTQMYLNRLVLAGIVTEKKTQLTNGLLEKEYSLVSKDLSIINDLSKSKSSKQCENELTAHHFAVMTKQAIKCAGTHKNKPYQIGSYFMKVKLEDMEAFKHEIDALFDKFRALEDTEQTQTYSLFTVMAPYEEGGELSE